MQVEATAIQRSIVGDVVRSYTPGTGNKIEENNAVFCRRRTAVVGTGPSRLIPDT